MNVKELKDELEKYNDEDLVYRVFGTMSLSGPYCGVQKRYMTHPLSCLLPDDKGRCLLFFEEF